MDNLAVHKVGSVDDPKSRRIRIVHISDTHMFHDEYLPSLPDGDILIHSGDFSQYHWTRHFRRSDHEYVLRKANEFFGKLPHKHKVFVAGNHELGFDRHGQDQATIQTRLPNATYLQDSSVVLEGIRIYGSPWTPIRATSFARGFSRRWGHFEDNWEAIPKNTDILVTHVPPHSILDLAKIGKSKIPMVNWLWRRSGNETECSICGPVHPGMAHWGCLRLKDTVLERVRPKLHLYGHVHESYGVCTVGDIIFSNAAMRLQLNPEANVFDFYIPSDEIDTSRHQQ